MLSKLEQAEQARVLLEKHIEKAEKPIVFEKRKLIQMKMMNVNIVMKNFKQKHPIRSTYILVLYVKQLSKSTHTANQNTYITNGGT